MSVDDVVTAIDLEHLTGDEPCGVMRKKGRCDANVVDVDQFARRRLHLRLF